jgi:tRNA-specific 2-thiouridylase
VLSDGTVLGEHDGVVDFTIGQRKGLGVALGERRYVVDINPNTATVTLGSRDELLASGCLVDEVSFVAGEPPTGTRVDTKIRYRSTAVPATIESLGDSWRVVFDEPQPAVAPGQSAVFYRGDEVLGGGVISKAVW